jgi:hypothetical protein
MMHITADQAFQPLADALIGAFFYVDLKRGARVDKRR